MRFWALIAALPVLGLALLAPAALGDDPVSQLIHKAGGAPPPQKVQASGKADVPKAPLPIVLSARIGEHTDRTRLVLELSDPVQLHVFSLANPDRVVIDMPEVIWKLGAPPRPSGHGAIKSYRYGRFRADTSRMVLDLNHPVRVADTLVIPPSNGFGYRVVIDLFPTGRAQFDAKAGWPAALKKSDAERLAALIAAAQKPPPPAKGGKRPKIVVIDPGHGGLDPGTTGVNGLQEKDLVLAEGLRLAKVLRARGYDVHMTRDDDTFIPLRQRVAIARADKADLMISLHADSNPDSSVTGLSIYTLSDGRSDREAAALARRENQSDIIAGVDLSGDNNPVAPILIDLAQRDTINKSSRFATTALARLRQSTDILAQRPHRSASLAVLVAPDVPAVLIELGYLSNRSDAAQMNTSAWRARVADAIADAVDQYFAPPTRQAEGGR